MTDHNPPADFDVTLVSSSDTPEQVQAALEPAKAPTQTAESTAPVPPEEPKKPVEESPDQKPAEAPKEPEKPAAKTEPAEEDEAELEKIDPTPPETASEDEKKRHQERRKRLRAGRGRDINYRMGQLTEARRVADEKVAELERQLAAIQAGTQPEPAAPAVPERPKFTEPKPELANFSDFVEYEAAKDAWSERKFQHELKVELAERDRVIADQARARAEQEVIRTHLERTQAFRDRTPDFDDALDAAKAAKLPITREMSAVIQNEEDGPAVAYYLATHPDETKRIATLHPAKQLVELGKVQARLQAGPSPKPSGSAPLELPKPKPTPLPEPITPVAGSPTAGGNKSLEDIVAAGSYEEFAARRNAARGGPGR